MAHDACMEVAVLVSGVADPKWPLPQELSLAALQSHAVKYATLSPFDEAALEIALKLRDRDPVVRVTALVAADEGLARKVAGWRPDAIHRLELAQAPRWDAGAVAQALAQALRSVAPDAGLVLIGREFGDFDDGSVAAALAQATGTAQVSLAMAVESRDGALWSLRQGSAGLERVKLPPRALLCATNDPGNRLRHPLMKNVMLAKKARIPETATAAADDCVSLERVQPVAPPERSGACEWLEGTPQQKARELARLLAAAAQA